MKFLLVHALVLSLLLSTVVKGNSNCDELAQYFLKSFEYIEDRAVLCNKPGIECDSDNEIISIEIEDGFIGQELPYSIKQFKKLEKLTLNNCSIIAVNWDDMKLFTSLSKLSLSMNRISGLIPNTFEKLEYLDLSNNKITLPPILISNSLKYLYLHNNSISGNIESTEYRVNNLVELRLDNNNLTGSISDHFEHLTNLRLLNLSHNSLASLPFALPSSLKYLYLQNNDMSGDIGLCEFMLENLVEIRLDKNMLTGSIPGCLRYSLNLSLLNISYNYIRSISDGLSDTLEYIYLYRNNIADVTSTDNILPNLIELDISCNQLTGSIPKNIVTLKNIHKLNMSHNYLTTLPYSLPKSLKYLYLSGNNISTNAATFGYISRNLVELDLSLNYLTGNLATFFLMPNIVYLNLSYNTLSRIPVLALSDFKEICRRRSNDGTARLDDTNCLSGNLVYLDISHNNLAGVIPQYVFFSKELVYVNLSYNKLIGIIPDVSKNTNLVHLYLNNNYGLEHNCNDRMFENTQLSGHTCDLGVVISEKGSTSDYCNLEVVDFI